LLVTRDEGTSVGASANDGGTFGAGGVSFALLAHPAVQAVRFLSKVAIPWFVTTSDYGEGMLAGLILFGIQHVAVFGLDEALVSSTRIDRGLWDDMRRFQMRLAVTLAVLTAFTGFVIQIFPAQRLLGELVIALAPMLYVATLATLPTALLVRERRYAQVFAVDVVAIASFTSVGVLTAWLGAGPWSLACAWHANALGACIAATLFASRLLPKEGGGTDFARVRRKGAHFTGAAALGYVGERLDSVSIGFALERAMLGLYEFAQNLAQVLVNYASSLSERLLFPTLAAHHREAGLGGAYLLALRITTLVVLPLHVLLAFIAQPLVTAFFPLRWHAASTLLVWLALSAATRCFDVVAVAALKAAGRSRTVFRLGVMRLVLLAFALAVALPHGIHVVVVAVFGSRACAALAALLYARRLLDLEHARREAGIARAVWTLAAWAVAFVPLALVLDRALDVHALALIALQACLALALWSLMRALFDRDALARELQTVRTRLSLANGGGAR
jgi:O-antigen/teichoic acid export membrane protein